MSFEKALSFVLEAEGGYSNNPSDSGGATNKGVTQATYNSWRKGRGLPVMSVRSITDDEVSGIYRGVYWNQCQCEGMPDELATAVFDTAVNTGCQRAVKILQACLDIDTDGVFGADTMNAIGNILDLKAFVDKYLSERSAFYQRLAEVNPDKKKFLAGWLNRVENLRKFIFT